MKKMSIHSRIITGVLLVHLIFILPMLFTFPKSLLPQKKQHRSIIVKTVTAPLMAAAEKKSPTLQRTSQKSPKIITSTQPQPTPLTPPVIKKTNAPQSSPPKTQAAKPITEKKAPQNNKIPLQEKKMSNQKPPASSSKPPVSPSISPSLLQQLEKSIAIIEDKGDKQNPKKKNGRSSHAAPTPLQIDKAIPLHEESPVSGDYTHFLVQHLHACLNLPDFGEVKIELTLRQDGTVAKLKVLNTESQQNKKYLETELPRLKFPHLTGACAQEQVHAFVLTFCNEL